MIAIVAATVAAGRVNWHYLAILLVPSAVVILMMALTWSSRSRRARRPDGRSGASRRGGKSRAPRGGAKRRRR